MVLHLPTDVRANLVIAGVTKAGSTALLHYLGQHPEICAEHLKEAQLLLEHPDEGEALEEAYAAQFAHCRAEAIRLEASPAYFGAGPDFPAKVDRRLPSPRILLTLRDPVERIWSGYKMKRSKALVPAGSFEAFVTHGLQTIGHPEQRDRRYEVFDTSAYDRHLPAWIEHFEDRLLLLFFDDLASDTAGTVRRICSWLHVDDSVVDTFELEVHNRSFLHRSERIRQTAGRLNHLAARRLKRHPGAKDALVRLYERVNGLDVAERMHPDTRARLAEAYEPHNRRLAEFLLARGHRDLPAWLDPATAVTAAGVTKGE